VAVRLFQVKKLSKVRTIDMVRVYRANAHLVWTIYFLGKALLKNTLLKWRKDFEGKIEFDFDSDTENAVQETRSIEIGIWYKLAQNTDLWKERIIHIISSDGAALSAIVEDLKIRLRQETNGNRSKKLCEAISILEEKINIYYRHNS